MIKTESQNSNTENLDQCSSQEFVDLFLEEDKAVGEALKKASSQIAQAIEISHQALSQPDARLFYLGAGTSGRLGILDAAECPPTFSTDPELVQGIIAGGDPAITKAVEGAEDSAEDAKKIISEKLKSNDVLIAISASGGANFVIEALKTAQELGAKTIAIANNPDAEIFNHCDHKIFLDTGPEILAGSTRLKAGTAQKITLNMISTGLMVKLGKTYKNLMVDLQATNSKLMRRATKLVMQIANVGEVEAKAALEASEFKVKHAVLKIMKGLDYNQAEALVQENKGFLRNCID